MELRFVGTDGSMSLRHGLIYRLSVQPWRDGVRIVSPVVCPYESQAAFWRDWTTP
jgi:hypothetical protein